MKVASREVWSSKNAFVLAAIGSAIGLGNIWRFPYVTFENGGGAFLVAYFVCLFLAGIPLLMLELSMGHQTKQAAPGAFAKLRPRMQWFGWFTVGVGFVIVTYYAIIMAWSVNYTWEAATLGWQKNQGEYANMEYAVEPTELSNMEVLVPVPSRLVGTTYTDPIDQQEYLVQEQGSFLVAWEGSLYAMSSLANANTFMASPGDFFFNDFLGLTSEPWDMGKFRWPLLVGFIISWVWIVASVWKGTKTVGKVVYYTVFIPWGLLVLFIIRGMTLPGAGAGLSFYLTPVWEKLLSADIWLAAISQVFFSLSVGFAIMIAYGSFLPKKTNIAGYAIIIGIADALTAFCGGLAVFSALGYQATKMGVPVTEVAQSGPGLAFVAYPHIISNLPGARVFGVLFFLMLLTLAVDSAFSLLEAATSSVKDKWKLSHKKANLTVGGLCFLFGLPMLTGSGLYMLDIADHFMNSFGLTIAVLVETIMIGWVIGAEKQREYISRHSSFRLGQWWSICIRWLIPMSIIWMLFSEIADRAVPYGSFGLRSQEFIFGWLIILILPIAGDVLANARGRGKFPDNE